MWRTTTRLNNEKYPLRWVNGTSVNRTGDVNVSTLNTSCCLTLWVLSTINTQVRVFAFSASSRDACSKALPKVLGHKAIYSVLTVAHISACRLYAENLYKLYLQIVQIVISTIMIGLFISRLYASRTRPLHYHTDFPFWKRFYWLRTTRTGRWRVSGRRRIS